MKYKDCPICTFYENKEKSECAGNEKRLFERDHCPEFSTDKSRYNSFNPDYEYLPESEKWDF